MANVYSQFGRANVGIERIVWPVAVVLTAVFMTCLQFTVTHPYKLETFQMLAHFHAPEPFQHRVLIPAIVAGLRQVLPVGDALLFAGLECIGWIALIVLAYRALVFFGVGRGDPIRRVLAFVVVLPMLIHLVIPEIYMPQAFITSGNGLTLGHPILMHLLTPNLYTPQTFVTSGNELNLGHWKPIPPFYYDYDLPAAVFTLALVLLLAHQIERPSRRGWALYLTLFAIATLNRETTVFLISFFALLFWARLPWRRWLGLLAVQTAIFILIQLPLHWLFHTHTNPSPDATLGGQYEDHLFENLGLLANPLYLMIFLARFMAGLYVPVLLWWRFLDWRVSRALAGFALPLIIAALIAGRMQEHRIFIEAVPLIWLAAMQAIARRSAQALAVQNRS
jgi:hypothetical protein